MGWCQAFRVSASAFIAELVTERAHAIMAGAPADIERIATENGLEIWSSEVRVFLLVYGSGGDSAEDRTGSAG